MRDGFTVVWNGRRDGPNGGASLAAFAHTGAAEFSARLSAEACSAARDAADDHRAAVVAGLARAEAARINGRAGGLARAGRASGRAPGRAAGHERNAAAWRLLAEPRRVREIVVALKAQGFEFPDLAIARLVSKGVGCGVVEVVDGGHRGRPGRYRQAPAWAHVEEFPSLRTYTRRVRGNE